MKNLLIAALCLSCLHTYAQNFSLSFNGTSQYVSVPDKPSIELSNSFTVEGWVYPIGPGSQPTEGGMLINKENSYEIARFADGTLQYALSANGLGTDWAWVNTGLVIPLNNWSHFAFVKSGTAVTVYLNGSMSYSNLSNPATLAANMQELRIGNRFSMGHYFNGTVDEFRIWNVVRSQAAIKAAMFNQSLSNAAAGLVAYYRMNENTGSITANSCTNTTGLDGTLVSSPSWLPSPVQFSANALSFDGTNDVVNIPDNSSLHIATAITLEAWVYATKNTGVQNVVNKSSNSANNGYIFPRTDDGWANAVAYLHIAGGWRTLSAPYPSLNAWHHLAVTYDGTVINLYIDGALANSKPQTGSITVNSNPLTLGNQTGFSEYFGGYMDEVRIWNIARTQAQIQNGKNWELDPTAQAGLVSYYTLDQGSAAGSNTGLTTAVDQAGNNNGVITNFTLATGNSNFVTQNATLITLPVSWHNFTAQKQGSNVLVSWSTTSEVNAGRFFVQHSMNRSSWEDIGNLVAAGSGAAVQEYSFVDNSPADGINYYRISEQDIDGKTTYSKVVSLVYAGAVRTMMAYPNPVTGGLLHLYLPQFTSVSLYSNNGKLIMRKQLSAGTQQLDLHRLPKGVYQLKAGSKTIPVLLMAD